ncbi:hypothetical protein HOY82DRAFT_584673 [Tuber indicum]|nr:hypothetical protein HOY82DRAFT_584673 [Tuber indicum]
MSVPSASGWLQDAPAVQNSTFAGPEASSVTAMHSPFDPGAAVITPSTIDHHQFQQQAHPRAQIQNGNPRTSSPGFQQPAYNVNPVVPLKRPRPREDPITVSPRQTTANPPTSRSQTPHASGPQLAYQIYQSNAGAAPQRQYTPVGYSSHSHLQHVGSANASPSPVMQNQTYNQPPPKRVATQSPSPFSPAPPQQPFMPQGSPPPNQVSRVSTPQNSNMNLAPPPQTPYSQSFTQAFSPPSTAASAPPTPVPNQQMQNPAQAHMMYQLRTPPHMGPNSMNPGQIPRLQGQQSLQGSGSSPSQPHSDPNQFMKSLYNFMSKNGTPIQGQSYIGGRAVSLVNLYTNVLKLGGSQKVTMENKWHAVSMSLGFSPESFPTAADDLVQIFKLNLSAYEQAWLRDRRDPKKVAIARGQQSGPDMRQQMHPQQQTKPMPNPQQMQHTRPQGMPKQPQTPVPNNHARSNLHNGFIPQPRQPSRQPPQYSQLPSTPNRISLDSTPPQGHVPPNYPLSAAQIPVKPSVLPDAIPFSATQPQNNALKEIPSDFKPKVRGLDTHGGLNVSVLSQIGNDFMFHKPTTPTFQELGVIDVHALTMMLKCGISAEVRLALDTLATVSVESRWSLALESCEDLIETLVDVAESQVEILGEHAEESSEAIAVPAYEDIVRACKAETVGLIDVARFGSLEHELEKSADKLICITTIFRNLSFFESNHKALADPNVVRFLSGVIERLGTSKLLLRTNTNTLDFMKDIIIFLSNLSHSITLPSEDEALNLLHLILAFAPQPLPAASGRDTLMFTSYSPSVHRYLPPAVDSLAKLLARDEPNRAFYRTIFLSESSTTPSYDLLTRSFALAISPIPDNMKVALPQAVEARKPFLEQGMLAAEILAGIAPGPDQGVARSWLSSEDGFALSLLRLVCLLSPQVTPMHPRQSGQTGKMSNLDDSQPFARITHRGMGVLQKLAEKSGDAAGDHSKIPLGVLPKKESLLGALLTVQIDGVIVKKLCTYAGLNG